MNKLTIEEAAKQAQREYQRKYYSQNRERVHANNRRWRAANRDKVREYNRRYWLKRGQKLLQQEQEGGSTNE